MPYVIQILQSMKNGDTKAVKELLPLVYDELRKLAAAKMTQEKPGQTLQATALVHDAYSRLAVKGGRHAVDSRQWQGRGHFYSAAAEAMRRILVENARRKRSLKGGGEYRKAEVDLAGLAASHPAEELTRLSEALDQLADEYPPSAELVKLRYFTGLSIDEAAEIMNVSHRTADRYWAYAKA